MMRVTGTSGEDNEIIAVGLIVSLFVCVQHDGKHRVRARVSYNY